MISTFVLVLVTQLRLQGIEVVKEYFLTLALVPVFAVLERKRAMTTAAATELVLIHGNITSGTRLWLIFLQHNFGTRSIEHWGTPARTIGFHDKTRL